MSYDYWNAKLRGEQPAVTEDRPEWGFYCKINKSTHERVPVAIWANGDVLKAKVGENVTADPDEVRAVWFHVAKHAVTEEAYRARMTTGQWPDEIVLDKPSTNMPEDPHAQLLIELQGLQERAEAALKKPVKDQAAADVVANIRDLLGEVKKKAEGHHTVEKAPHLEAGRLVDKKWKREIIDVAEAAVAKLRAELTKFLSAEKARREREAQEARRLEEERLKAERDAKAADGTADVSPEAAPPPPAAPPPRVDKVHAGGAYGSRTGLKNRKIAVITDYDKALQAVKHQPAVKEAVEAAVRKLVLAGAVVDGAKLDTVEEAA